MVYKQYCFILLLCFFSWTSFAQSLLRGLFPEYEVCSCTNDKFTKQLTQPYEAEIQVWLAQTQEERILPPPSDIAMEEEPIIEEEDTGVFSSIGNFFTGLFDWDDEEEEIQEEQEVQEVQEVQLLEPMEPLPLLSISTIPSICFKLSGNLIRNEGIQKQFYSCVHEHYDNSDEDNFCFDTRDHPDSPKKCEALPIPCDSSDDLNLVCPQEYTDRIEKHGPNGCNKGAAFPRRPCLNQDYIAMTAKAFHDVAECLNIDPALAFPIFLHESRFILNIQSHTGALCYGQITGNAVADFNSFLKSNKSYPNYDIPDLMEDNIEKKCPHIWKHFKKVNTITKANRSVIRSDFDQCHMNLNPYTCFFYSFGYMKILYEKAKLAIADLNNVDIAILEDNSWSFVGYSRYSPTSLPVVEKKRIKLFEDEQDLLHILTTIAYNGGLSIIQIHFQDFIERLKTSITNEKNSELQSIILNNNGLPSDFFKKEFSAFLQSRYFSKDERRNGELYSYLNKVISETKDLNQLIRESHPYMPDTFDVCPSLVQ